MNKFRLIVAMAAFFGLINPVFAQTKRPDLFDKYIRLRDFAKEFEISIEFDGKFYTLLPKKTILFYTNRLSILPGSTLALYGKEKKEIRLPKPAKIDSRGLLVPAESIRIAGCAYFQYDFDPNKILIHCGQFRGTVEYFDN